MSPGPLSAVLTALTADLYFSSESDFPVLPLSWPQPQDNGSLDAGALRARLRLAPTVPVEERPLEALFRPMTTERPWHGPEERETTARFQALVALLKSLRDLRAYRVGGGPEIEIYVVGRDASGNLIGVQTRVTET